MYGGCRGNENNFKTRRQCADACSNSEENPRKITLPILIDELPKCEFNGRQFNVGDVLRFAGNNGCDTCTCSSPPALTCTTEKCPTIGNVQFLYLSSSKLRYIHTIRKVKFLSNNSILTKPQHFHEFFTQKSGNQS